MPVEALILSTMTPQIGLLAANAVLWGLRPGKYTAKTYRQGGKVFKKVISSAEKWLDLTGDIEITREKDKDGKYIFNVKGIPIIDSARKITSKARYNVKLEISIPDDGKLSLGEIDFSDWQTRKDFLVTVTDKDDKSVNDKERNDVLETLKLFPKVLADGKNRPTDKVEKITESSSWKVVNWYHKYWGRETVDQHVAPGEGHSFLYDGRFTDDVITIAARDRKNASSIIKNYFATIEHSVTCQLKLDETERDKLVQEVKARQREFSIHRYLTAGKLLLAVGVSILIIAIATIAIFNPALLTPFIGIAAVEWVKVGIGVVATTFFHSIAAIKNFFLGAFDTLGLTTITAALTAAAAAGSVQAYRDYKRQSLEDAKVELQEAEELVKEISRNKEEFENEKLGVARVLKASEAIENDVLDLSVAQNSQDAPLGVMGAKLLRNYLSDSTAGAVVKPCISIKLCGNNLQQEELAELKLAIQNSKNNKHFRIETIDLSANQLDKCVKELQGIAEALKNNFTIVDIIFDDVSSSQKKEFKKALQDIRKETLINCYLQGRYDEKSQNMQDMLNAAGFISFAALRSAAAEKLDNSVTITNISSFETAEALPLEVQVAIGQNKLFGQLSGKKESGQIDYYGRICIEAFAMDATRCIKYFSVKENLSAEHKHRIRKSLGETSNIEKLMKVGTREEKIALINILFTTYTAEDTTNIVNILELAAIAKDNGANVSEVVSYLGQALGQLPVNKVVFDKNIEKAQQKLRDAIKDSGLQYEDFITGTNLPENFKNGYKSLKAELNKHSDTIVKAVEDNDWDLFLGQCDEHIAENVYYSFLIQTFGDPGEQSKDVKNFVDFILRSDHEDPVRFCNKFQDLPREHRYQLFRYCLKFAEGSAVSPEYLKMVEIIDDLMDVFEKPELSVQNKTEIAKLIYSAIRYEEDERWDSPGVVSVNRNLSLSDVEKRILNIVHQITDDALKQELLEILGDAKSRVYSTLFSMGGAKKHISKPSHDVEIKRHAMQELREMLGDPSLSGDIKTEVRKIVNKASGNIASPAKPSSGIFSSLFGRSVAQEPSKVSEYNIREMAEDIKKVLEQAEPRGGEYSDVFRRIDDGLFTVFHDAEEAEVNSVSDLHHQQKEQDRGH